MMQMHGSLMHVSSILKNNLYGETFSCLELELLDELRVFLRLDHETSFDEGLRQTTVDELKRCCNNA